MYSIMKCLQPTRVAVVRASGDHVFVQSHRRSLPAVASAVEQWISSKVASLSWRSAIVALSQSLTPASTSRGRLSWFQESHGPLCVWNKEDLGESWVFSAVIGVCAGLMSASVRRRRKRASCSLFVMVVVSCFWGSSSDEDVVSLARWERRANFPVVSFAGQHHGFEARSILYAVRYAESNCPPGRLLILSDDLALVLALCKGRSNMFTWLAAMRRIFASRSGTVRIDLSKSLLHVLAQGLTRTVTGKRPRLFFSLTDAPGWWSS